MDKRVARSHEKLCKWTSIGCKLKCYKDIKHTMLVLTSNYFHMFWPRLSAFTPWYQLVMSQAPWTGRGTIMYCLIHSVSIMYAIYHFQMFDFINCELFVCVLHKGHVCFLKAKKKREEDRKWCLLSSNQRCLF